MSIIHAEAEFYNRQRLTWITRKRRADALGLIYNYIICRCIADPSPELQASFDEFREAADALDACPCDVEPGG